MNPNMVRWITASCRSHFNDRKMDIPLFFPNVGSKRLQDELGKPISLYAEFRVDGPYYQKMNAKEERYDVDLNVLCQAGINTGDSERILYALGIFSAAFTDVIPVFRFGRDTDGVDDQSLIGCLIRNDEKNEAVRVSQFGQANPDTQLAQASVDGSYRMRLTL